VIDKYFLPCALAALKGAFRGYQAPIFPLPAGEVHFFFFLQMKSTDSRPPRIRETLSFLSPREGEALSFFSMRIADSSCFLQPRCRVTASPLPPSPLGARRRPFLRRGSRDRQAASSLAFLCSPHRPSPSSPFDQQASSWGRRFRHEAFFFGIWRKKSAPSLSRFPQRGKVFPRPVARLSLSA